MFSNAEINVATSGSTKAGSEDVENVSDGGSRKRQDASASAKTKEELDKLAKSLIKTGATIVKKFEMTQIQNFLSSVYTVCGCVGGTCSVVVHTLTQTDVIKKNQIRIPRRAFPDDLADEELVVIFHPDVRVEGELKVLNDGRVEISCWKKFIDQVGWKLNTKIVMLFCQHPDATNLLIIDRLHRWQPCQRKKKLH